MCFFLKVNFVLLSWSLSKTWYCLMVLIEFFSQKFNKGQSRPQGQCLGRFGHIQVVRVAVRGNGNSVQLVNLKNNNKKQYTSVIECLSYKKYPKILYIESKTDLI